MTNLILIWKNDDKSDIKIATADGEPLLFERKSWAQEYAFRNYGPGTGKAIKEIDNYKSICLEFKKLCLDFSKKRMVVTIKSRDMSRDIERVVEFINNECNLKYRDNELLRIAFRTVSCQKLFRFISV